MVDTDRRQVFRGGEGVALSPKAYQLLTLLIAGRPKAIDRDKLYRQLWPDTFVVPANLANLVGEVRSALGDSAHQPRFIRTLHGYGYAFVSDVEVVEAGTPLDGELPPHWIVWNGQTFALRSGENVIGRGVNVQVRIDELGVSRRHARILITADVATIEDLKSKNGTFVDGQRVSAARRLTNGDVVRFGPVGVTFHSSTEGMTTLTAADLADP
jgi:DNA-binding winged helix-turn-helix (wHTH) protein